MKVAKTAVDRNAILSPWYKEILSQDAQKVYVAVWLRMNSRNATEAWLTDEDLSRRARVVLPRTLAAKTELVRYGLMHIDPRERSSKYEFIDAVEEAGE
jgi:hypothetical protein